jgi:cardiolipin synthase A/B
MRMSKTFRCLAAAALLSCSGCSWLTKDKRIRVPLEASYSIEDPRFRLSASGLLGAPLVPGNDVIELRNGKEIFPAMVEAIRQAQRSVNIEMFIWSSGQESDRFVDAIVERARAGVKVRVLVDSVGGFRLKHEDVKKMADAGADVVKFNRLLSRRLLRINLRTHRKIMIVDGKIAFTGGVCISDDWSGDADPPHWRDTHFKIRGPVVAQIQGVFLENWLQARSEVFHGEDYFPPLEPAGAMTAQFVKSGYHDDAELTRLSYLHAIAAARKNIRIAHAYFVPDSLVIDALLAARKRGVEVQILVPAKTDNVVVGKAARPRWGKLIDAGAEFWEYQPTLYHCKIMVVDDVWSIVGSVNFDERSMRLSDEANLNVFDRGFAAALTRTFEEDKTRCRRLTARDAKKRNILSRITDHFFGLFRGQL